MIPRAYWKLDGRHGHPPCFPTSFAWYLFMLYVDALLSFVLPFLRVGLKVFSTGKLLFDVALSFDFVSELLPLFACCWACNCCCCWYSMSFVSQILDQMRFASPSCSSWYQATAKSMINKHRRWNRRYWKHKQCLLFFSLSVSHTLEITFLAPSMAFQGFSQIKKSSP